MKKKNIINLIRYYAEKNDSGFRAEAYEIAKEFEQSGDSQLASYIMALLSDANAFVPQSANQTFRFMEPMDTYTPMLFLPNNITNDILGAVNAVEKKLDINKFLFYGAPGTGKTDAAKQFARILNRHLFVVDFSTIIDSRLGQTNKNLVELFHEINTFSPADKLVILFDEFDAIALDRVDSNDLREMGRAASELLKLMDRLNHDVVLVATTNLYEHFDKAITRRFDAAINFNRYSQEDLLEIAERLLNFYLSKMKVENKDIRLFRKILRLPQSLPTPGILKNIIKISIAFSDPGNSMDYMRRLYEAFAGKLPNNPFILKKQGFTIRESGILLHDSKSSIERRLKGAEPGHA